MIVSLAHLSLLSTADQLWWVAEPQSERLEVPLVPNDAFFRPDLFQFLRQLKRHNNRDWFAKNKQRYEEVVRDPALTFISSFGPHLRKLGPHFVADPRPPARLALPDIPRHPVLARQAALQDPCRHPFLPRQRQGRPCARVLPPPGAGRLLCGGGRLAS